MKGERLKKVEIERRSFPNSCSVYLNAPVKVEF